MKILLLIIFILSFYGSDGQFSWLFDYPTAKEKNTKKGQKILEEMNNEMKLTKTSLNAYVDKRTRKENETYKFHELVERQLIDLNQNMHHLSMVLDKIKPNMTNSSKIKETD